MHEPHFLICSWEWWFLPYQEAVQIERNDVHESLEQNLTTDRISGLLPTSHGDPACGTEPDSQACIWAQLLPWDMQASSFMGLTSS